MRETATGWGQISNSLIQPQPVPEFKPRNAVQLVGPGLAGEGCEPVLHCRAVLSARPGGNRLPMCPGQGPFVSTLPHSTAHQQNASIRHLSWIFRLLLLQQI